MTDQESHPMGKCTEEVKTLVPPEVKDDIKALATLNNQTLSDYVRDVLLVHTYGRLHVARVQHHAKP